MVSIEESRRQIEQARAQVTAQRAQVAAAQRGIASRIERLPPTGTREALLRQRGIASIPRREMARAAKERLGIQREQITGYGEQVGGVAQRVAEAEVIQQRQEEGLEQLEKSLISQTQRIEALQQKVQEVKGDEAQQRAADRLEVQQEEVSLIRQGIEKVKAGFSIGSIRKYISAKIDQIIARQSGREERIQHRAQVKAYEAQLKTLEEAGFKPIKRGGVLVGFDDTITKQCISIADLPAHL